MTTPTTRTLSTIAQLRKLRPDRPLTAAEAMVVAERQAGALLRLGGITELPVPDEVISELARIQVTWKPGMPLSGLTDWSKGAWRIEINATDARTRQRFSLFHEFKHVLDHHFVTGAQNRAGAQPAISSERVCDYFAACALMPNAWVKRAFCDERIQDLGAIALRFGVSQAAMRLRLIQIGLREPEPRCRYQRDNQQAVSAVREVAA